MQSQWPVVSKTMENCQPLSRMARRAYTVLLADRLHDVQAREAWDGVWKHHPASKPAQFVLKYYRLLARQRAAMRFRKARS